MSYGYGQGYDDYDYDDYDRKKNYMYQKDDRRGGHNQKNRQDFEYEERLRRQMMEAIMQDDNTPYEASKFVEYLQKIEKAILDKTMLSTLKPCKQIDKEETKKLNEIFQSSLTFLPEAINLIANAELVIQTSEEKNQFQKQGSTLSNLKQEIQNMRQVKSLFNSVDLNDPMEYLALSIVKLEQVPDKQKEFIESILSFESEKSINLPIKSIKELFYVKKDYIQREFVKNLTSLTYTEGCKDSHQSKEKARKLQEKIEGMFNRAFLEIENKIEAVENTHIEIISQSLKDLQSIDLSPLVKQPTQTFNLSGAMILSNIQHAASLLSNSMLAYQQATERALDEMYDQICQRNNSDSRIHSSLEKINPQQLKELIENQLLQEIYDQIKGQEQGEQDVFLSYSKSARNLDKYKSKIMDINQQPPKNQNNKIYQNQEKGLIERICDEDWSWSAFFQKKSPNQDIIIQLLQVREQTFLDLFNKHFQENINSLEIVKRSHLKVEFQGQKIYLSLMIGNGKTINLHENLSLPVIKFILGKPEEMKQTYGERQLVTIPGRRMEALLCVAMIILYSGLDLEKELRCYFSINLFKEMCFACQDRFNQSFELEHEERKLAFKGVKFSKQISEDILFNVQNLLQGTKIALQRSVYSEKINSFSFTFSKEVIEILYFKQNRTLREDEDYQEIQKNMVVKMDEQGEEANLGYMRLDKSEKVLTIKNPVDVIYFSEVPKDNEQEDRQEFQKMIGMYIMFNQENRIQIESFSAFFNQNLIPFLQKISLLVQAKNKFIEQQIQKKKQEEEERQRREKEKYRLEQEELKRLQKLKEDEEEERRRQVAEKARKEEEERTALLLAEELDKVKKLKEQAEEKERQVEQRAREEQQRQTRFQMEEQNRIAKLDEEKQKLDEEKARFQLEYQLKMKKMEEEREQWVKSLQLREQQLDQEKQDFSKLKEQDTVSKEEEKQSLQSQKDQLEIQIQKLNELNQTIEIKNKKIDTKEFELKAREIQIEEKEKSLRQRLLDYNSSSRLNHQFPSEKDKLKQLEIGIQQDLKSIEGNKTVLKEEKIQLEMMRNEAHKDQKEAEKLGNSISKQEQLHKSELKNKLDSQQNPPSLPATRENNKVAEELVSRKESIDNDYEIINDVNSQVEKDSVPKNIKNNYQRGNPFNQDAKKYQMSNLQEQPKQNNWEPINQKDQRSPNQTGEKPIPSINNQTESPPSNQGSRIRNQQQVETKQEFNDKSKFNSAEKQNKVENSVSSNDDTSKHQNSNSEYINNIINRQKLQQQESTIKNTDKDNSNKELQHLSQQKNYDPLNPTSRQTTQMLSQQKSNEMDYLNNLKTHPLQNPETNKNQNQINKSNEISDQQKSNYTSIMNFPSQQTSTNKITEIDNPPKQLNNQQEQQLNQYNYSNKPSLVQEQSEMKQQSLSTQKRIEIMNAYLPYKNCSLNKLSQDFSKQISENWKNKNVKYFKELLDLKFEIIFEKDFSSSLSEDTFQKFTSNLNSMIVFTDDYDSDVVAIINKSNANNKYASIPYFQFVKRTELQQRKNHDFNRINLFISRLYSHPKYYQYSGQYETIFFNEQFFAGQCINININLPSYLYLVYFNQKLKPQEFSLWFSNRLIQYNFGSREKLKLSLDPVFLKISIYSIELNEMIRDKSCYYQDTNGGYIFFPLNCCPILVTFSKRMYDDLLYKIKLSKLRIQTIDVLPNLNKHSEFELTQYSILFARELDYILSCKPHLMLKYLQVLVENPFKFLSEESTAFL